MKLRADAAATVAIQALGDGWVQINGQAWRQAILVDSRTGAHPWQAQSALRLSAADFEAILALEPELVIYGSGSRQRFPAPACIRPLVQAGIGLETMSTAAACRTYNILAQEGRRVVAALLIEPDTAAQL